MYLHEEPGDFKQRYGRLLCISLEQLGIPHLIYRPCLVQHIDGKSTYNGEFYRRNTIYFKDYLDKLGITMLEAYKPENRKKLRQLLEADRAIWYSE